MGMSGYITLRSVAKRFIAASLSATSPSSTQRFRVNLPIGSPGGRVNGGNPDSVGPESGPPERFGRISPVAVVITKVLFTILPILPGWLPHMHQ